MKAKGIEKKNRENSHTYSQSAMEYLMTYGWAILIIAVILGVLFSLGVFNPVNYAPKVPAGNCHVFRPNGPGTSFDVGLVGTCSGFLPQYVAHFDGSSYVEAATTPSLQFSGSLSVTAWVYLNPIQTDYPEIAARGTDSDGYFEFGISAGSRKGFFYIMDSSGQYHDIPSALSALQSDTWYFMAITLDSSDGNMTMYQDSASYSKIDANAILPTSTLPIYIGQLGENTSASRWNGSIANVQIYNASLDANEIQYLYNEGIGGAPIYLSHLVGWWPLNGDTKDYSGNGNDGTPENIAFNGSWESGYSQP